MFDLACFFLPSFCGITISPSSMYMYIQCIIYNVYTSVYISIARETGQPGAEGGVLHAPQAGRGQDGAARGPCGARVQTR